MLLKHVSESGKIFNSSIPDDFEEGLQNWHLEMISENMHLSHYSSQSLILLLLSNLVCGLAFIANSTNRDPGEEGIWKEELSYLDCPVGIWGGHCLDYYSM